MDSAEIEKKIPDADQIVKTVNFALDYWRTRNQYIEKMRDALEGLNPIKLPAKEQYNPQAIHTFFLASILNEKIARFLDIPTCQVVNENILDNEEVANNSDLEHALNILAYEMERLGDGDVWSRVVADAILLDEGVEKIQFIAPTVWPNVTHLPKDSEQREKYKKDKGPAMRSLYVPLEATYPIYDGAEVVENYEFEIKSLASCKRSKSWEQGAFVDVAPDPRGDHATKVTILHYSDAQYYAYFMVVPGTNTASSVSPESFKLDASTMNSIAEVRYLYGYQHGMGRVPYNFVAGRYGGWKTQNNRIEAVNKGFLELSQAADELLSQVATNVRATLWPTLNYQVNPELRGEDASNNKQPPNVSEGEAIYTYVGEELKPIITAQNNPQALWLMDQYKEQLGKLGGSSVLFGSNQPGVDTGYHNAQQVSQAEHLDEKIEQHLARGAVTHYTMMLLLVKFADEKLWVNYKINDGEKVTGKFVAIDPKQLNPIPRIDVSVRRPRGIDLLANIRAARDATDDRNGRGPLISDLTARDKFLALEYPDREDKRTLFEKERQKIIDEGVITEHIKRAINIGVVKSGIPNVDPQTVAGMDPALLQALQATLQQAGGAGGVDPSLLARGAAPPPTQPAGNNPLDRTGGLPAGQAQPEANVGYAAQQAGIT